MFSEGLIKKSHHAESNFELQITALIDTLVIILIFLLKSVSIETLEVEQAKGISIPSVNQGVTAGKGAKLSIGPEGISWNGTKFVNLNNYVPEDQASAYGGANWNSLAAAIETTAKQEKDGNTFSGALFVEADKNANFQILSQSLKSAKQRGYRDIRFVGARYN